MPAVTDGRPSRDRAAALWARPAHPGARRPALTACTARHPIVRDHSQSRMPRPLPRLACSSRRPSRLSSRAVGTGTLRKIPVRRFLRLSNTSTPTAVSSPPAVSARALESRQLRQGHAECPHRAIGQVGFSQVGIADIYGLRRRYAVACRSVGQGRGPRCGATGRRPWKRQTCVVGVPTGVCFTAAALSTPFLAPAGGRLGVFTRYDLGSRGGAWR
jgi:hypothetical protein